MTPDGLRRRRAYATGSIVVYVAIVALGIARVEVPGLGLAHLLYVPIVLLALATGPFWGAAAGACAAAIYATGSAGNSHFAPGESLTYAASAIRFTSFVGIGWLVGSSALHNRRLLQKLREHAERDFLTDLLNTRAFESELTARLEREEPFALLLADVDGLKKVNDTEGHHAGNEHLRVLSAALREATAPEDTVARIGGDEFAVLTKASTHAEAELAETRLQAAIARRGVSVSLGFAVYPAEGTDRLTLFHSADKRLYERKLAGTGRRLRVVGT